MTQKREGRGRPAKDDDEAVSYVLRLRRDNPRVGYREAARRYFQAHPKKLTKQLESEARRVGDKAAYLGGRRPTRSEHQLLKDLHLSLLFAIRAVQGLLERWKK